MPIITESWLGEERLQVGYEQENWSPTLFMGRGDELHELVLTISKPSIFLNLLPHESLIQESCPFGLR
jgi:hypothetical protein